ncbi:MAG: hypothetical protein AAFR65_01730 [Pseudomonadota bacterium]
MSRVVAVVLTGSLASCAMSPVPVDQLPDVAGGSLFVGVPDWCQVVDTDDTLIACEGVSIRMAGSQAAAREEALEKSYASIARKLEANVTSVLTVRERMEALGAQSTITRSVIEEAVIEVEGVPITGLKETNSAAGDVASYYYVRVELHRPTAEGEILGKIAATDAEIAGFASAARTNDRLDRARALFPVIALAARRDKLERELALVGMNVRRAPMDARVAQISQAAVASLDGLRFVLRPGDSTSRAIQSDLAAALRDEAGINLQAQGGPSDVVIAYSVRESFFYENRAQIFSANADINGNLLDSAGNVLSGFRHEARGFGGSRTDARRDYQDDLASAVAEDIVNVLLAP